MNCLINAPMSDFTVNTTLPSHRRVIKAYGALLTFFGHICWDSPCTPTAISNQMLSQKEKLEAKKLVKLGCFQSKNFGCFRPESQSNYVIQPIHHLNEGLKAYNIVGANLHLFVNIFSDLHYILNNPILHLSCRGGAFITSSRCAALR